MELSKREVKITIINMLKTLVENMSKMHEQMENSSKIHKLKRIKWNEMNSVLTEMKNAFQRLTRRHDTAEERSSDSEYRSIEITKTETQKGRKE